LRHHERQDVTRGRAEGQAYADSGRRCSTRYVNTLNRPETVRARARLLRITASQNTTLSTAAPSRATILIVVISPSAGSALVSASRSVRRAASGSPCTRTISVIFDCSAVVGK
jgi:hypothetical protein